MWRHAQRSATLEQRAAQFSFGSIERQRDFPFDIHLPVIAFWPVVMMLMVPMLRAFIHDLFSLRGSQCHCRDNICVAWLHAADTNLVSDADVLRHLLRQMRREVDLPSVVENEGVQL